MSNQLLASKIVIVEEEPRQRSILSLPTAIAGAIGITERGPVGQPVLVTSFDEFVDTFGGFTANSSLTLAVSGFFDNGGQVMWIVRTVHYANVLDAATKTSKLATHRLKDRAQAPLDTLRVDGKWDGTYANDVRVVIAAAPSGSASEFNLSVEDGGLVREVFANVSMDPRRANYVEAIVNNLDRGPRLLAVSDPRS